MTISKFAVIIHEALNRQVPVISSGARLLSLCMIVGASALQWLTGLGVRWQQPKAGKIIIARCVSWENSGLAYLLIHGYNVQIADCEVLPCLHLKIERGNGLLWMPGD